MNKVTIVEKVLNDFSTLTLACDIDDRTLPVFADFLGKYNPEEHWLAGSSPKHPLFDKVDRIKEIVGHIKFNLHRWFVTASRLALTESAVTKFNLPYGVSHRRLRETLVDNPDLWIAVLSAQKYGTVYWLSRSEARRHWPMDDRTRSDANDIDRFLRTKTAIDGSGDSTIGRQIMNFAFFHFVKSSGLKVDTQTKLIPPNALSCLGKRHISVREQDFFNHRDDKAAYGDPLWRRPSHLRPARSFPSLCRHTLPRALRKQVRRPSSQTRQEVYGAHPSTITSIWLTAPITPVQLAVLAQNKAYELTASELEQRVFTRGGAAGDSRDVLNSMTAVERIEFLANDQSWLYFEVRNTVKPRAHKAALGIVARWRLWSLEGKKDEQNLEDIGLVKKVLENIEYVDWERGERLDLLEVVGGVISGGNFEV